MFDLDQFYQHRHSRSNLTRDIIAIPSRLKVALERKIVPILILLLRYWDLHDNPSTGDCSMICLDLTQ